MPIIAMKSIEMWLEMGHRHGEMEDYLDHLEQEIGHPSRKLMMTKATVGGEADYQQAIQELWTLQIE